MNNVIVDTDKIKSVLLKNFIEIKSNLEVAKKDLELLSFMVNSGLKEDYELLYREITEQYNTTNDYKSKLEGIVKDFNSLSDNYIKKIESIEILNASSLITNK